MMGIQERKEREKEARREEILNAAEKVFFEKGLPLATMDEIAERAELSKGTLYLYYRSKEDLYLAVAMRGHEIMYNMFARALSTDEPTLKKLRNILEAYYEYFKKHRNYFRMLYFFENPQVQSQVSPEMMQHCVEQDRKLWQLVISHIQKGIDEGLLHRGLDPMEVGVMMWSNTNGLMRLMDRQDRYWSDTMGMDLERLLFTSNALLMEAMMTEKAQQVYPGVLQYHEHDRTGQKS